MPISRLTKEQKQQITDVCKVVASRRGPEQEKAAMQFAQAIEVPLRKVLLSGDIVNGIFSVEETDGRHQEYPLDLLTPGQEQEFYAYVYSGEGRIPDRRVEGDYLMVPTYMVANSIDCTLKFLRDANWPVIQRMLEILEAGFIGKMNDDGWQTILSAATDRNILVSDPNAAAGQFTPRLITLMSTIMRRNGGGNSSTLNRSRLTDLYVSPEAHMDIRAWGLDQVSDNVRENIYYADENDPDLIRIFGVNLHALDEFGEGQEYQTYFTGTLGGSMASSDLEIVVGLDQQREDSFVHPVREELEIVEDNTMHRQNLFGLYGKTEVGFAVLDSRRTLLGSL